MGSCLGNQANSDINKKMREEEQSDNKLTKLLFLGPGGSGKSTMFKQLQWLHGGGFSENDAKSLTQRIHTQMIDQMKDYIKHYHPISDSTNNDETLQTAIDTVRNYNEFSVLTHEIADHISFIWQTDDKLPEIFKMHQKKSILEPTTSYFWDNIERISADDYIPNQQDIINVRYMTTGIIDKKFKIRDLNFHIFDVGGQKSERKKWMQCFGDVNAVVFVVNVAGYDQTMYEDNKNKMVDSLELFKKTVNDDHFKDTPVILFLNKRDLFVDKIKTIPITACPAFDDFNKNPNDYDDVINYISSEFEQQCDNKNRSINIHVTCAMEQENIHNVFDDVTKMIVEGVVKNMSKLYMN